MGMNYDLDKAVCAKHKATESEYDASIFIETEVRQQGVLQLKGDKGNRSHTHND